jgi:CubicO group peptidase (beta-lactamase class C family)
VTRNVFRSALGLVAAAIIVTPHALAENLCQPETELVRGHEATEFDRALQGFAQFGFSGVVLVLKDGEPVLRRSYGFSNHEEGVRNTVNTPFPVSSVTKQFVATAVLRLQMEGKLRTSDPVSRFLGKFPGQRGEPTIHDLLTHTSGLIHPDTSFASHSGSEFVAKLKLLPREAEPGERYRYSNGGYSLLAAIIERASGKTLDAYLQENLFQPAGMACTGFTGDTKAARGYEMDEKWIAEAVEPSIFYRILASRYQPDFRAARPIPDDWSIHASGGIVTTLGDIEKWERAIEKNSPLSEAATRAMFTPYVPLSTTRSQAYAWIIERTLRGHRVAFQYGDYWGYQSGYIRYLDDGLALFVAANVSVGKGPQGWRSLVRDRFERTFHLQR